MKNTNLIIAVLALSLGLAGTGLGAYAAIIQGPPGPPGPPGEDGTDGTDGMDGLDGIDGVNGTDGLDAPGFYCFTQEEIQSAIDLIGLGSGIITIMENLVLSAAIDVDGGGNYIIQGYGLINIEFTTCDCAFNITSVKSCVLRDLTIDLSNSLYATYGILVAEINDNPIYIENIHIYDGGSFPYSNGIQVLSENVIIRDCRIEDVLTGIDIRSNNAIIYDNKFIRTVEAIFLFHTISNIIKNNYIQRTGSAISCVNSNNTIISFNIIKEFSYIGIFLTTGYLFESFSSNGFLSSFYNEIVGNQISISTPPSVGYNRTCIGIEDSHENQIIGNYCFKCINENPSYYGIGITLTDGDNNHIATNTLIMNDVPFYIDSSSTGNVFLGNVQ